ncbi:Probable methyltransferase At1g29790 [Linum grandiflorum]
MSLNLLLLLAMVATNLLSLYHLTSNLQSQTPPPQSSSHPIPDHLLRQLSTIRAAITHLTRHQPPSDSSSSSSSTIPPDLLLYAHLFPIASACHNHPDLLHKYMSYKPYSACPLDSDLAESLILRGCHPLPRRRCFARTPQKPPSSLPRNPFPSNLLDSNVIWSSSYTCKSFSCLAKDPNLGFDFIGTEISRFMTYKTELDLPIPQLIQISDRAGSPIRLGLDIGGGTGTFAARMKQYNVTVVTTTMNFNAPNSEAVAMRGLVPIHAPLQQRLPVFDGVVDLVRCGRAVNRWIPTATMEFLLYDVDRILRGGGYLWMDHFFSKGVDLGKVYGPLIGKLGYKKVKWAVANKTDSGGLKNGEVYLTALLQKPVSRSAL